MPRKRLVVLDMGNLKITNLAAPTEDTDGATKKYVDDHAGGGGYQPKVSSDDTTPGYLEDKIAQGDNIVLTVLNPGGNEQIEISSTASGTGNAYFPAGWG